MGFGSFGDGIGDGDGDLIFLTFCLSWAQLALFFSTFFHTSNYVSTVSCILFVFLRWLRNCHCLEGLDQIVVSRVESRGHARRLSPPSRRLYTAPIQSSIALRSRPLLFQVPNPNAFLFILTVFMQTSNGQLNGARRGSNRDYY
jgi:hypothetical protein